MESLTSGTMAGAGSFRCKRCGYVLTLTSLDRLGDCPGCGGRSFARASLFSAAPRPAHSSPATDTLPSLAGAYVADERSVGVDDAIDGLEAPGEYVVFEEDGEVRTVALTREWTRIGRSLAADVRFDDPTVSRRHALVVRQADGVRVLDDRSLNGVFVNGERIEWRALNHGDEIVVGRYRLVFVSLGAESRPAPAASTTPAAA
jgi:pSer/pThr/pTyr-binding forkhead associated (FHA) protein/DNA-directed RNA polymerase subunit RPC12/RpoP